MQNNLRELICEADILRIPCCGDVLSALLVEQAGFEATFLSGFSASASYHGLPDTGYIHGSEMTDISHRITTKLSIPLLVDGDTGYGSPMNVRHTVRRYAHAGASGLFIEDQVFPKRCGHTRGKTVVARDEMLLRMRAAIDEQSIIIDTKDRDIVIGFRTDAIATHGLDEALWRAAQAIELGADFIFIEAPTNIDDMQRICDEFKGMPLMANMLIGGNTPLLTAAGLQEMGFAMVTYPVELLSAAVKAMQDCLSALNQDNQPNNLLEFSELTKILGFDDYDNIARRYM